MLETQSVIVNKIVSTELVNLTLLLLTCSIIQLAYARLMLIILCCSMLKSDVVQRPQYAGFSFDSGVRGHSVVVSRV